MHPMLCRPCALVSTRCPSTLMGSRQFSQTPKSEEHGPRFEDREPDDTDYTWYKIATAFVCMFGAVTILAPSEWLFPEEEAMRKSTKTRMEKRLEALRPCPLSKDKWIPFKIMRKVDVSHDTSLIRFELPDYISLNLPIASCVLFKAPGDSGPVIRPYTPISSNSETGYFDFVIKHYPDGKMTSYLKNLKEGDVVEIKGPFEKIAYSQNMADHIVMIAGGSGLTPMVQVVLEILEHSETDKTKVTLLFANNTEEDILMKHELDELSQKYPQFKVKYVVAKPSNSWTGYTGFLSADILKEHMPQPSENLKILVCGPPGMMKAISGDKQSKAEQGPLSGLLKELGYSEDQVYKF